jgi:Mor family transcriptional regulator
MQMLFTFLGGLRMTIPDLEELYRRERNRRLRDEFHGANHEELALKYKISTQHVRNILKRSA